MSGQQSLDLLGGSALIPDAQFRGEFGAGEPMPVGPYTVGLTRCEGVGGEWRESIPWVIRCADGRAVAGHVPSREIAEAIAAALNGACPLTPAEAAADSAASFTAAAIEAIGAGVRDGSRDVPTTGYFARKAE